MNYHQMNYHYLARTILPRVKNQQEVKEVMDDWGEKERNAEKHKP